MFIGIIRQKKPDREEKRSFRSGFSAALSGWVRVILHATIVGVFQEKKTMSATVSGVAGGRGWVFRKKTVQ
jgi:hypothetical protein